MYMTQADWEQAAYSLTWPILKALSVAEPCEMYQTKLLLLFTTAQQQSS